MRASARERRGDLPRPRRSGGLRGRLAVRGPRGARRDPRPEPPARTRLLAEQRLPGARRARRGGHRRPRRPGARHGRGHRRDRAAQRARGHRRPLRHRPSARPPPDLAGLAVHDAAAGGRDAAHDRGRGRVRVPRHGPLGRRGDRPRRGARADRSRPRRRPRRGPAGRVRRNRADFRAHIGGRAQRRARLPVRPARSPRGRRRRGRGHRRVDRGRRRLRHARGRRHRRARGLGPVGARGEAARAEPR